MFAMSHTQKWLQIASVHYVRPKMFSLHNVEHNAEFNVLVVNK